MNDYDPAAATAEMAEQLHYCQAGEAVPDGCTAAEVAEVMRSDAHRALEWIRSQAAVNGAVANRLRSVANSTLFEASRVEVTSVDRT